jgi:hypothetical protein
MVDINLDPEGRLTYFVANPPRVDDRLDALPEARAISFLFEAAGLDAARFTSTSPRITLPHAADTRMAWSGSFAHAPQIPIRVETSFWKGRLATFEVLGPWAEPSAAETQARTRERLQGWIYVLTVLAIFASAVLVARRNLRLGRGDARRARTLAVFVLGCTFVEWLCLVSHNAAPAEYNRIFRALGEALVTACAFGVLYLALEPYVRRRNPEHLVG